MNISIASKPAIVVWTDISNDQIRKLDELTDSESINRFFIKLFDYEPNTTRTTILCDLFYYALNFARTNKFNNEQISTFLSILKRVHEMCIRTPFANMEETYQYFKALILKHSLSRPPHNLRIFTPDVTKKVTDYIIDTYFRHFKMYKYIFTPTIDFNLKFTYEGMTRELPKTTEDKESVTTVIDTEENESQQQQEHQGDSQLAEVRKLIQNYVKDEIRKTQGTTEEEDVPRVSVEKSRPVKSSSTRTSKPQTPK